eukprot:403338601
MQTSDCYKKCNDYFSITQVPERLFCKKGCDADEDTLELCKMENCSDLCIKKELGDDDKKLGSWSALFSRAPVNSDKCLEACYFGCMNRVKDDDDKN